MENNILAFQQSLADGELVDASAIASDAGFEWPLGMAKGVHAAVARQALGRVDEAVWDLLFAARLQVIEHSRTKGSDTELEVSAVVGARRGQGVIVRAQLVVGVDETAGTPCVVLMKPASLERADKAQ